MQNKSITAIRSQLFCYSSCPCCLLFVFSCPGYLFFFCCLSLPCHLFYTSIDIDINIIIHADACAKLQALSGQKPLLTWCAQRCSSARIVTQCSISIARSPPSNGWHFNQATRARLDSWLSSLLTLHSSLDSARTRLAAWALLIHKSLAMRLPLPQNTKLTQNLITLRNVTSGVCYVATWLRVGCSNKNTAGHPSMPLSSHSFNLSIYLSMYLSMYLCVYLSIKAM